MATRRPPTLRQLPQSDVRGARPGRTFCEYRTGWTLPRPHARVAGSGGGMGQHLTPTGIALKGRFLGRHQFSRRGGGGGWEWWGPLWPPAVRFWWGWVVWGCVSDP